MAFEKCKKCGEWTSDINGFHRCPPAWIVWEEKEETEADDGKIVHAFDEECAATKWAEQRDANSAEYEIASDKSHPIVCVRSADGGPVKRFRVRGEYNPEYHADESYDEKIAAEISAAIAELSGKEGL